MSDKIVFGDVLREFLPEFLKTNNPCPRVREVLTTLSQCGTEEMGKCSYHCWDCGHEDSFNLSCRDRHCPSCHTHHKEQWLEARMRELLPVQYFHVVFTIPALLHSAMMGNMKDGYNALFKAATETLKKFAKEKNVQLGMTMVLHTWGSNMSYHPHVHVLVPGGGIDLKTGKWVRLPVYADSSSKRASSYKYEDSVYSEEVEEKQPFLFPVKALSVVFRAKFIQYLTDFCGRDVLDRGTREECFNKGFVVYAKAPAAGPEQVLEYLARYSYGIAISNSRITEICGDEVAFRYKDYKSGGVSKIMHLKGNEFLRRFSKHILPERFTRIRHCGFLAPSNRKKLAEAQLQLNVVINNTDKTARNRDRIADIHAPRCGKCHSLDIHISIGYKKKYAASQNLARIRSPDPLQIAV